VSIKRVHLIGICGTAMATLAALLKGRGYDVRGSDQNVYPPMSDFLVQQGITTHQGYSADHITADLDLVVVGNAISRGNPELEEVLDRKIRYSSLPEAVRDHFLWASRSIVIAGTHGKTTTTSLVGWLLAQGGADPSVFIGGIAENFESSYRIGGGRDFVIEGDEYDSAFFDKTAKFLKYLPDIAVVNNIEFDHVDIYPDLDAIRLAFRRFVNLVPRRGLLLLGADNADALALKAHARSKVETFGLSNGCDWQAHDLQVTETSTRFGVRRSGTTIGTLALLPGSVPTPWRKACGPSKAFAGVCSIAAPRPGSRSTTISLTTQPRLPRRSRACVRLIPLDASGQFSSLDRRRHADECFNPTSRGLSRALTGSCCRLSFVRRCRRRSVYRPRRS
jgi:UDP-N-acetylmuramate:L-alanyl-gamma-D-glutamyl-meso-diaminopimelate ligase